MSQATRVVHNLYRDSVSLMELSAALGKMPGMEQASVVMATPANVSLLREALFIDGEIAAGPNDLLIVLRGRSDAELGAAMQFAEKALNDVPRSHAQGQSPAAMLPKSVEMALSATPAANFALSPRPGICRRRSDEGAAQAQRDVVQRQCFARRRDCVETFRARARAG
jgi:hypothetical protein